jgi:hypothetical protein
MLTGQQGVNQPAAGSPAAATPGVNAAVPSPSAAGSQAGSPTAPQAVTVGGGEPNRPMENVLAEFNRKSSTILAELNEMRQWREQQLQDARASSPSSQSAPVAYPPVGQSPQSSAVGDPFAGMHDDDKRLARAILSLMPQVIDSRIKPIATVTEQVRMSFERQERERMVSEGEKRMAQLAEAYPIFKDPVIGEDAKLKLSALMSQNRYLSPVEAAQQVDAHYKQLRAAWVGAASAQAQQVSAQAQQAAGAVTPSGGASTTIVQNRPRSIAEAGKMVQAVTARQITGQAV